MPRQTLAVRVDRLEETVTVLEQLPVRLDAVESQILQLREEMHRVFFDVHAEIRAVEDGVTTGFRLGDERLLKLHEELKAEVRAGNERIMSQARTLYEDLKASWALMQEGNPRPMRASQSQPQS